MSRAASDPTPVGSGAGALQHTLRGGQIMATQTIPARVSARRPRASGGALAATASATLPSSLVTWYLGLIPHWMGATPGLRCRILLRTHQWIIDRVLAPEVSLTAVASDLRPNGALTEILSALLPADASPEWQHFIQLVVANLRHALLLPVARRNEAWLRWLFLIPYSIRTAPELEQSPADTHRGAA
jgi:hypothetical protein